MELPSGITAKETRWRHLWGQTLLWEGRREKLLFLAMVLGAGAYILSPVPLLALGGWVLFLGLAVLRYPLTIPIVVFAIPFYWQPKSLPWLPFSPTEFVLVNAVLAVGINALPRLSRSRPHLAAFDWGAILFIVLGIASLAVTEVLPVAIRELRVVIVEPALFFFLVTRGLGNQRQIWWLVDAMVLATLVVALFGIYQYLFTEEVIVGEGVARVRSVYPSPNNLSLFLGRVVPVLACLVLFGKRLRPFCAVALVTVLATAVLTYSFGASLGLFSAAIAVAIVVNRRVALFVGMVAVAALLLATLLAGPERLVSHFTFQEGTTASARLYLWMASVNMALDHPIMGVGLDNFLYQYEKYRYPEIWWEVTVSHPHNFILDFWLRLGLPGLILFLWLLLRFIAQCLRLWRDHPDPSLRALALGLFASMVDAIGHGFFDNSYFLVDLAMLFWLSLALVQAMEMSLVRKPGKSLTSSSEEAQPV